MKRHLCLVHCCGDEADAWRNCSGTPEKIRCRGIAPPTTPRCILTRTGNVCSLRHLCWNFTVLEMQVSASAWQVRGPEFNPNPSKK